MKDSSLPDADNAGARLLDPYLLQLLSDQLRSWIDGQLDQQKISKELDGSREYVLQGRRGDLGDEGSEQVLGEMILEAPAYLRNLDLVRSSTSAIISISEISRRVRMTSAFISSFSLAIKRRAELMFALRSTSSSEGSPQSTG